MTDKKSEAIVPQGGSIYARIPAIMRDIPAVPKDRSNTSQGYKFRGIDEVYNLIHPILAKHGVFMTAEIIEEKSCERPSKSGGVLITRSFWTRYRFTAEDGSFITTDVMGEGMDSGDKAANKAMSVGQKYAILQTFLVPTDDPKDPEVDSPEPAAPLPPAHDDASGFLDEPPAPSPFDQLPDFAKAKKALGDKAYYEILGQIGVEHANEIAVEKRAAVLKTMRAAFLVTKPKAKATK
jgi:hypothetical protein